MLSGMLLAARPSLWIRAIAIVMVIAATFTFSRAAYAHLYSGIKWRSMPVIYYVYPATYKLEYTTAANTYNLAPGSFDLKQASTIFDNRQGTWNEAYFSQNDF